MGISHKTLTLDQLEKFRQRVALKDPDPEPSKPETYAPVDAKALRGVPLVGVAGASGVIEGTRPGDPAWRLEKDDRYLRRARVKRASRPAARPA